MRTLDSFGSFGVTGFRARIWSAILGILLYVVTGSAVAQRPNPKNVLFVFSTVKYSGETLGAIEPYMQAHVTGPINFYYA